MVDEIKKNRNGKEEGKRRWENEDDDQEKKGEKWRTRGGGGEENVERNERGMKKEDNRNWVLSKGLWICLLLLLRV